MPRTRNFADVIRAKMAADPKLAKRMRKILCRLFGHRWEYIDREFASIVRQVGRVCSRCGWTQGRLEFHDLDERGELIVRSQMEKLEAKVVAEGGRCRWTMPQPPEPTT